jgi:hypothetical protein
MDLNVGLYILIAAAIAALSILLARVLHRRRERTAWLRAENAIELIEIDDPLRRKKRSRLVIGIFFSIVFLLLGLVILAWGTDLALQGVTSYIWPSVPARVTESEIVDIRSINQEVDQRVEIQYIYTVRGASFAGTRISLINPNPVDKATGEQLAAKYPTNKIIQVRYNPLQPAAAVIEPGLSTSFSVVYGFGWLFMLTSASLIYLAVRTRAIGQPLKSKKFRI